MPKKHQAHFEIYPDKGGKHRWRLRAANGVIIASSGESFVSSGGALHSIITLVGIIINFPGVIACGFTFEDAELLLADHHGLVEFVKKDVS